MPILNTSFQRSKFLNLPHGFFGRLGGMSAAPYNSLNCGLGSRDSLINVRENRKRVANFLGFSTVTTGYQTHSNSVAYVSKPLETVTSVMLDQGVDGLVTDRPQILLGVLSADCAPVLFSDVKAEVVGVCHAGWRGAVSGIGEATLKAMRNLGATEIVAAIGPAIGRNVYEVKADMRANFSASDAELWFTKVLSAQAGEDRWCFDLQGYVASRLSDAGIAKVETIDADTYSLPDQYFSARYAQHNGLTDYGRNLSVIGLN